MYIQASMKMGREDINILCVYALYLAIHSSQIGSVRINVHPQYGHIRFWNLKKISRSIY